MTEQEKQLIETLKRSFTRMEAFYKAKSTRIRVYEEKISQLEAENAALQKRLDNAEELPKIGDEIYIIEDGYCDCAEVCEIHIQEKDTIVEWVQWDRSNYETPEFYDEGEVLMSEYNKTWFTDRAKAEAHLAEPKKED